jgi:hypothetical protein
VDIWASMIGGDVAIRKTAVGQLIGRSDSSAPGGRQRWR